MPEDVGTERILDVLRARPYRPAAMYWDRRSPHRAIWAAAAKMRADDIARASDTDVLAPKNKQKKMALSDFFAEGREYFHLVHGSCGGSAGERSEHKCTGRAFVVLPSSRVLKLKRHVQGGSAATRVNREGA